MAEGKLGFKSGEGFRKWSADEQAALRSKVLQHLKKARDVFASAIKHRPRIRLTIRQRTRVLFQWPEQ